MRGNISIKIIIYIAKTLRRKISAIFLATSFPHLGNFLDLISQVYSHFWTEKVRHLYFPVSRKCFLNFYKQNFCGNVLSVHKK